MSSFDYFIPAIEARSRLHEAGYDTRRTSNSLESWLYYWKQGVSGRITCHPYGVDNIAIMRLEDKGS